MRVSLSIHPASSRAAAWTLAVAVGAAGATSGLAAEPADKADVVGQAEALVEEALTREIYGLGGDRDALLEKAAAVAPGLPAAKWHRGLVFADGKWTPAEEVAADAAENELLAEYVAKRDDTPDTVLGHATLANWCASKKLAAQEHAHLARVLTLDPENARARTRLGFVRVNDEWVGREEMARAVAEEAKAQASISKFRGSFEDLARMMGDRSEKVRERAAEKIRAIRDVNAVPALETLVAGVSEEASLVVVETIAAMPEKEASLSLARFSVFSPSSRVRLEASDALADRKLDQFVPQLLASMTAPTQTQIQMDRGVDGRLVYRHSLYREGMNSADLLIRDTIYDGTRRGTDAAAMRMANGDFGARTAMTEAFVTLDNLRTHEVNSRIGETLSKVTDQKLGEDAQQWWTWWNQHNEIFVQGQKPIRTQYASNVVQTIGSQMSEIRTGSLQTCDCLAAGTPVFTNRGAVAIDQVRIGDLVLSQDVESGELAYRPVMETTVRPAGPLLRVDFGSGSMRCSGGHPLWVSGEGWVKARDLKSGMELHTLDGTVRISDVVLDGQEETFNLVVDGFASYFAGDARILSHDNTVRRSTDAIVPGLEQN